MKKADYDRNAAAEYALRWALSRNKKYFDFSHYGGDCTNFVSQCIYAGSEVMNFTPIYGWYYISSYDRSPSWTDVGFLYDFLVKNKGAGPFGKESEIKNLKKGDIIQLYSAIEQSYYHSLIIVNSDFKNPHDILVCAHTFDSRMRPLSTYKYDGLRCIHIEGVRLS